MICGRKPASEGSKVMSRPELIMFDLGNVLVDFDFKIVIKGLARYTTKSPAEIRAYFKQTPLWDKFERGAVTPDVFFHNLTRDLELKGLTFAEFQPLWNIIFKENSETVQIVDELRKSFRLAMISNVNQLHWDYVREQHAFMHWFEIPVASYAVGHRKPELEIYRHTLKKAKVAPEKAIFIDDIEAHITAARSIGIRGHQFVGAAQLRKDLAGLLA
jgi:putative hydrolase of the HAD superfamily